MGASGSFAQLPANGGRPSAGDGQSPTLIYVVRRGWHIDIGFAVLALEPPLKSVAARFPDARYVFFGFGDQHYLLAKHRNGPVLLGALWPGRGLILATALDDTPQAAFGAEHVIVLTVSSSQAQAAQAFVARSLDAPDGHSPNTPQGTDMEQTGIEPYAPGPYEDSLYFAAKPTYSALHTCNTWVAEALKAAQLPIHSGGVIFAGQLWGQVRRLSRERASVPNPAQLQGGLDPF